MSSHGDEGGKEFPAFPFPPYPIQLGFMRSLYQALEQGGVGLFESPTGTGKTLSLICGSLHWLQDHRRREAEASEAGGPRQGGGSPEDEPDWMRDFASQQASQRQEEREERRKRRVARAKAKLGPRPPPPGPSSLGGSQDADAEFLVDDWNSQDEGGQGGSAGVKRPAHTLAALSDSDDSGSAVGFMGEEEVDGPQKTQIIFCSRTHSQLTQFVGELHRTAFADSMSLVALASRRALCVNDAVLRLNIPTLINERCLELQKPAATKKTAAADADDRGPGHPKRASGRCPYLGAGSKAGDTTRDMILAHPMDIEELAKLGRRRSVCTYYAARKAVPEADIILAPYSALLVAETRQSLGLRVEGNVVIVDEGHNLVDAINSSHSAELSAATAAAAHRQLSAYFDRFSKQLAPGNARNIQALIRVAEALAKAATPSAGGSPRADTSLNDGGSRGKASSVNDFLFSTGLDNVNMFRLVSYVRETKAVFKIAGFWQAAQQRAAAAAATDRNAAAVGLPSGGRSRAKGLTSGSAGVQGGAAAHNSGEGGGAGQEGATGSLQALLSFLQALTNDDADGRIVVNSETAVLKFVLLNAAAHFAKVVSAARGVVLASGTLSPLESVLQLFPATPSTSIHRYSCGHVVGAERLLALVLGAGPSGVVLDFRHAARALPATMDELGRLVANVCAATPGGVVVFFPSFSYADMVHARWEATGALSTLGTRKAVFREPRAAGEVESVLEEYGRCIEQCAAANSSKGSNAGGGSGEKGQTGAVMLCVVGGKLAEGINFGDALGRCVVMVGLPYPNPSDPELQERLRYIERTATAAGGGGNANVGGSVGAAASREHYQNLCMKAVNQCVGRVIRHKGDYAAILLVDARYVAGVDAAGRHTGPVAKLPDWIKQSLMVCGDFGSAYGRMVRFFKGVTAAETP